MALYSYGLLCGRLSRRERRAAAGTDGLRFEMAAAGSIALFHLVVGAIDDGRSMAPDSDGLGTEMP